MDKELDLSKLPAAPAEQQEDVRELSLDDLLQVYGGTFRQAK